MAQRQFKTSDTSVWNDRFGNGTDGIGSINTSTDGTANTTLTGTSGGTAATVGSGTGFSNGNLVLIHQTQGTGAVNWELNKISSGGGTTSWTMAYTFQNTYGTGAQVYLLKQYSTVTVNSGQTLTASAWNGTRGGIVALIANVSISVAGTIILNGNNGNDWNVGGGIGGVGVGFKGGAGTIVGGGATSTQGEGTTGTGSASNAANGNGGGGATSDAAGIYGTGGSGGNANAGSTGASTGDAVGGTGGNSSGSSDLTTISLGGGGGGQSEFGGGAIIASSGGGAGAGMLFLFAPTITFTGSLQLNGGAGGNGQNGHMASGGAGGSCLIKGQIITLGSNLLTATGGAGGATGSVGRIHADYSGTITGTTNPTITTTLDGIYNNSGGGFIFGLL